MSIPAQLFRLEQLDAELDQLQHALTVNERKQVRNPELETAEKRLDGMRRQERELATQQRGMETELADLEARIKRDQSRMYGGTIVDARELGSLEKELEHYRAQRDELEERLLGVMERAENLEHELAAASRQSEELRERTETDRPALAREAENLADSLAALQAEREALLESVDKSALHLYGRLRAGSGHAVSSVSQGVCQWCRVSLPAKDVQHARAGALVTCTNCARILYVGS